MSEIDSYSDWSKHDLIQEIKKLSDKKKYGLVWEEEKTREVFEKNADGKLPILLEDDARSIIHDSDDVNNILIEGDNYHALSVLNYTHKEKIDVIYIDPPYNTGNEFIYNDKIVDSDDAYRHSKWLSFMSKRIRLAKNVLCEKGIIFISIDEHEESQLKLLCNEIFGESNFIAKLVWKKKYTGGKHARFFVDLHEYVLVYAKNIASLEGFTMKRPENEKDKFNLIDKYVKERGKYYTRPLKSNLELRPTLIYDILLPDKKKIKTQWIVSKPTFEKLNKDGRILFKKKRDGMYQVYMKYYENDKDGRVKVPSIIDFTYNNDAKVELKNLFHVEEGRDNVFYTVKPTKLIAFLIGLSAQKKTDLTILDFMAGSGTTGHSVLQLNKDDGIHRKFILCTNNENNICTDICYPRIKKVIQGYKNLKGEKIAGLGSNLIYFKTSFVDSYPTDQNKKIMVLQSTKMLCLKENCFELVKQGKQFKIFKSPEGTYMAIIYYYDGIVQFKKEVLRLKVKINTYVFSLTDKVDSDDFVGVEQWVNLKPIPSVILNVYRRIFAYVQTKKLSRKSYK